MQTPKFRFRTYPAHGGQFYAAIARLHPHTYGAHTRLGKRTVMKPSTWVELGKFPTREQAKQSARDAIQAKLMAFCIRFPEADPEPKPRPKVSRTDTGHARRVPRDPARTR